MNGHPKWNFQEFSTFLLIYAASADHIVTPEEEAMMYRDGKEVVIQLYIETPEYRQSAAEYPALLKKYAQQTKLKNRNYPFEYNPQKGAIVNLVNGKEVNDVKTKVDILKNGTIITSEQDSPRFTAACMWV